MASNTWRGGAAPLLALLVAACAAAPLPAGVTTAASAARPAAGGGWTQALTFTGDIQGGMDHVLPDSSAERSECSGRNSRAAGAWAAALYGPIGGQAVYEVVVTVQPYRGPGTYHAPGVTVEVAVPDGSAVWQTSAGDAATFTVEPGEQTGTVSATLTNLSTTATSVHVDGRWSCVT
jgi:hypothetical protein